MQYVVIWDGNHVERQHKGNIGTVEQIYTTEYRLTKHIFYWDFADKSSWTRELMHIGRVGLLYVFLFIEINYPVMIVKSEKSVLT